MSYVSDKRSVKSQHRRELRTITKQTRNNYNYHKIIYPEYIHTNEILLPCCEVQNSQYQDQWQQFLLG